MKRLIYRRLKTGRPNRQQVDRIEDIADLLNVDADELLARADRIATDVADIICRRPRLVCELVRQTKGLNNDEMTTAVDEIKKLKSRKRK